MLYLKNPINIIVGGYFTGDYKWNNKHKETDNCYKIYFITEGEAIISDATKSYKLSAGNLYLINGYKLKEYNTICFKTYWLHFIPQNIVLNRGLYSLETVIEIPHYILEETNKRDVFNKEFSTESKSNTNFLFHLKLQHLIHSIIIEALKNYKWDLNNDITGFYKIEESLKYIDEHFNENITLKQLSDISNISPSHYHRLFNETMHITPTNYIIRKRMNASLSLISDNNDIKEVAYKLGFCNDAYFSRIFKRYYGITPGEYKKDNNLIC